jgi:hypothetical protein
VAGVQLALYGIETTRKPLAQGERWMLVAPAFGRHESTQLSTYDQFGRVL